MRRGALGASTTDTMTTNPPSQLLTPEWPQPGSEQALPPPDPMVGDPLGALNYPGQTIIDGLFNFNSQPAASFVPTGYVPPAPQFGDHILFPLEDDVPSLDAIGWPAVGDMTSGLFQDPYVPMDLAVELAPYGPETAELLDRADLSDLSPEVPVLSLAVVNQSYPTPSSSASPSASQPSPTTRSPAAQHACAWCCESFSKARQLQLHTNIHTRPFKCGSCGKGHARKKDMHRHMWTHHEADARRLKIPGVGASCPVPGCGFEGRQDNVTRHIKTRHRGDPRC